MKFYLGQFKGKTSSGLSMLGKSVPAEEKKGVNPEKDE